ncbi:twin-arginine translocase TatA/TatE family subunit [Microbacterium testaceum]|uniref:twin-arginine translocase TatA/TatE family subunit n=1 Tax=Microbacterium testaceum TaxID=2033 RepID=UPI001248EEF1|nr:twin-arginine translocase TatA/TatE family subunit [Microbacterium testaceum]
MLQNLTGWHALIVLAVILLIFGAAKLPALARSLGQSVRILKTEVSDARADAVAEPDPQVAAASQSASARASASPVVTGPSTPSKT